MLAVLQHVATFAESLRQEWSKIKGSSTAASWPTRKMPYNMYGLTRRVIVQEQSESIYQISSTKAKDSTVLSFITLQDPHHDDFIFSTPSRRNIAWNNILMILDGSAPEGTPSINLACCPTRIGEIQQNIEFG